jgi:hypothetical protein
VEPTYEHDLVVSAKEKLCTKNIKKLATQHVSLPGQKYTLKVPNVKVDQKGPRHYRTKYVQFQQNNDNQHTPLLHSTYLLKYTLTN